MKKTLTGLLTVTATMLVWTGTANAQEAPPPPPPGGFPGGQGGPGGPGFGGPGGPGFGGPGGFQGRGMGMNREPSLATAPLQVLENALKLTDTQYEKLEKINENFRTERRKLMPQGGPGGRGGFGGPGQGGPGGPGFGGRGGQGGPGGPGFGGRGPMDPAMMEKMQALEKKTSQEIEAVLTPEQRRAAASLLKNIPVLNAVGIPVELWSDLRLSETQLAKLQEIGRSTSPENSAAFRAAREDSDREAMMAAMQKLRESSHKKALAVLSAEQRALVEKFIRENPRPQGGPGFGGPGGPGGPGFGGQGRPGGFGGPGGPPPSER